MKERVEIGAPFFRPLDLLFALPVEKQTNRVKTIDFSVVNEITIANKNKKGAWRRLRGEHYCESYVRVTILILMHPISKWCHQLLKKLENKKSKSSWAEIQTMKAWLFVFHFRALDTITDSHAQAKQSNKSIGVDCRPLKQQNGREILCKQLSVPIEGLSIDSCCPAAQIWRP